jgi:hypothetical protein
MAEKSPQTLKNHTRLDPLFHFFLMPVFGVLLVSALVALVRHPGWHRFLLVLGTTGLLLLTLKTRGYALKVQDRVIRLEERLRLATLLPNEWRGRIGELTEAQLIALRFASDSEVPALVVRVLSENLTGKQIKQSIRSWRPDYWRV